MTSKNKRNI